MATLSRCIALILVLLAPTANAVEPLCAPNFIPAGIQLELGQIGASDFDRPAHAGVEADMASLSFNSQWSNSTDAVGYVGFQHSYRAIDFIQPPGESGLISAHTNGDLHTTALPLHWQSQQLNQQRRFSVAPVIAVSSNVYQHPHQLSSDALQLWLAWEQQWQLGIRWRGLLGLCADHRFGDYRVYPLLGFQYTVNKHLVLRLAYPDSRLQWQGQSLAIALELSPVGNQWRVHNKGFTEQSDFQWWAWQWQLRAAVNLTKRLNVYAAGGQQFDQEIRFQQNGSSAIKTTMDDASYQRLGLEWQW